MDAPRLRAAGAALALMLLGAGYRTPNFVVHAPSRELATEVADTAEKLRQELAVLWLGQSLPNWARPCPIRVSEGPHLGAGGATSFVFHQGEVFDWDMEIQGSRERILDSVLPHEVTHTIFASHFRQPLPRWADEGACTTVEHESEKAKQQRMLVDFLQTGRGIPFSQMFAMKDYPADILPLYAQGFSLARFLIEQGGRERYIAFVGQGLKSGHWVPTTQEFYGFPSLAALQDKWLDWVRQGSPPLDYQMPPHAGDSGVQLAALERRERPEPNLIYRGQRQGFLAEQLGRLRPPWRSSRHDHPQEGSAGAAADAAIPGAVVPASGQAPAGQLAAAPAAPLARLPGGSDPAPSSADRVGGAPTPAAPAPFASPPSAPLPRGGLAAFGAPAGLRQPRTSAPTGVAAITGAAGPAGRRVIVEWTRPVEQTAAAPGIRRVERPVIPSPRLSPTPAGGPAVAPVRQPILFDAPPRHPTTVVR